MACDVCVFALFQRLVGKPFPVMKLFSRANSLGCQWRRVGGLLIPFLLAVEATAVDRTWDGGAAGADANWTTAANWTTNIAPLAGDLLIFASGQTKLVTTNTFPANTLFRVSVFAMITPCAERRWI